MLINGMSQFSVCPSHPEQLIKSEALSARCGTVHSTCASNNRPHGRERSPIGSLKSCLTNVKSQSRPHDRGCVVIQIEEERIIFSDSSGIDEERNRRQTSSIGNATESMQMQDEAMPRPRLLTWPSQDYPIVSDSSSSTEEECNHQQVSLIDNATGSTQEGAMPRARVGTWSVGDFKKKNMGFSSATVNMPCRAEMRRSYDRLKSTSSSVDDTVIKIEEEHAEISGHSRLNGEQILKNISKIIARNGLSVGVGTMGREMVKQLVLPVVLQKATPLLVAMLAGGVASIPIGLQLLGLARDFRNGTQTKETLHARVSFIVLGAVTTAGLVASGGVIAATASLISSILIYVPLRELIQYFLPLSNNNTERNMYALLGSAFAYAVSQIGVGAVMGLFPSATAIDIFLRSCCNVMGETIDEIICGYLTAWLQENPQLQYEFGVRPKEQVTRQTTVDQMLQPGASRASLFGAAGAGEHAVVASGVDQGWSAVIGCGILGLGYPSFSLASAQKKPPIDFAFKSA